MTKRFCVNCKHYEPGFRSWNPTIHHVCRMGPVSMVTGERELISADANRADNWTRPLEHCGREGRFFEPKVEIEKGNA